MKVTRDDWPIGELWPLARTRGVPYARTISPWAVDFLRSGFRPREMDDHWFIFEEDGVVHLYRSWTGIEFAAFELNQLSDGHAEIVEVWVDDDAEAGPGRLEREDPDEAVRWLLDFFFDSLAGVPTGSDLARHVFGLDVGAPPTKRP